MYSFLEEPRTIPKPTPVIQTIEAPSVPEVSLVFQNSSLEKRLKPKIKIDRPALSYNAWKLRNSPAKDSDYDSFLLPDNKENNTQSKEQSFLKKQVRFQNPRVENYLLEPKSTGPTLKSVENCYDTSINHRFQTNNGLNSTKPSLGYGEKRYETNIGHSKETTGSVFENKQYNPVEKMYYQYSVGSTCNRDKKMDVICDKNERKSPNHYYNTSKTPLVHQNPIEKMYKNAMGTTNANIDTNFGIPEKIYNTKYSSANFPNFLEKSHPLNLPLMPTSRELDLSFLDTVKKPCKPIRMPASKPFLNDSDCISDRIMNLDVTSRETITNYNPIDNTNKETEVIEQQNESVQVLNSPEKEPVTKEVQTEDIVDEKPMEETSKPVEDKIDKIEEIVEVEDDNNEPEDDPPTMAQLLQIIQLQNEQLQLLQSQINKLAKLNETVEEPIEIHEENVITYKDQCVGTSFIEEAPPAKAEQKISVGLMTSFEVNFKQSMPKRNKKLTPVPDESDHSSSDHDGQIFNKHQMQNYYPEKYENLHHRKHYEPTKINQKKYVRKEIYENNQPVYYESEEEIEENPVFFHARNMNYNRKKPQPHYQNERYINHRQSKHKNNLPTPIYTQAEYQSRPPKLNQKYKRKEFHNTKRYDSYPKQQYGPHKIPSKRPYSKHVHPKRRDDEIQEPVFGAKPNFGDWKKNETDYTMGPHQFLNLQHQSESPDNSIHIDMQDYESDDPETIDRCERPEPANRREFRDNRAQYPKQWKKPNETEYTLGPKEFLEVPEPPESPENSIHIDMQEYESDSSDDECSTPDSGWDIYKDILGQVNNFLDHSDSPNNRNNNRQCEEDVRAKTDTTLERIKCAAIKQLQNTEFMKSRKGKFKPNEISFAVKQILMKYMPDEALADAVNTRERHKYEPSGKRENPGPNYNYGQQCNDRNNAPASYGKPLKKPNRTGGAPSRRNNDPKVLDITTLKQQPKFL